jgi:hypothetical protein
MLRNRTVIVASTALIAGGLAYIAFEGFDIRGRISKWCEDHASEPDVSPDLARDAFTQTSVDQAADVPGHTHPSAAGARTAATVFAKRMASHAGSRLYVLGMSKSDQRKNLRGTRQWYWAKDTNVENRSDPVLPDDMEYICDVDYYIDMPELLASRSKPTLIYTVVPEAAASHTDDTSVYFENDGSLTTVVAGGGRYNHHLWDYAGDSIIVRKQGWFGGTLVTYALERKQVTANRQVILLTPIKTFNGLVAIVAGYMLKGKALTRFNPLVIAEDGTHYIRFNVHRKDGHFITTGKAGSMLCATIPAETDAAIEGVGRLGTTNLMLPTVASWLDKEERKSAVVLTEYHRVAAPQKIPTVYPVGKGVRVYQFEPESYDPDARCKLQDFMSALVHEAFAPANTPSSERRCVAGRVVALRKEEPRPHAYRDACMDDFVDHILEGMVLEPFCFETVAEKQNSPTQKLSLSRACVYGTTFLRRLKNFLKSEAYPGPKDPRNISMYNDRDKLTMSQFALSLSAHCKKFPWYAPGMTPEKIAHRVAEICQNAHSFVNISDYHRMDGTITYTLRRVDRVVMMKAFHHHRAVLNELLKRNVDNKGTFPNGTSYEQGPSHGSGCPATSLFQTLRAAFAAYLAFRHAYKPTGGRYSPREAFDAIGIHMGDDGLDADLSTADHQWACKHVGLILDASLVHVGERGVNFLARFYSPQVWTGSPDSMCDVKRQLSKFHTTVRLPQGVTAQQKLREKAEAYLATDSHTPVMGELCKLVHLRLGNVPRTSFRLGNWWSKFDDSEQYPNQNVDGWMDVEFSKLFPEFDRSIFNNWLAGVEEAKDLFEAPICAEPKRPAAGVVSFVVDDEIIDPQRADGAAGTEQAPTDETKSARKSSAPPRDKTSEKSKSSRGRPRPGVGKTHRVKRGTPPAKKTGE